MFIFKLIKVQGSISDLKCRIFISTFKLSLTILIFNSKFYLSLLLKVKFSRNQTKIRQPDRKIFGKFGLTKFRIKYHFSKFKIIVYLL